MIVYSCEVWQHLFICILYFVTVAFVAPCGEYESCPSMRYWAQMVKRASHYTLSLYLPVKTICNTVRCFGGNLKTTLFNIKSIYFCNFSHF